MSKSFALYIVLALMVSSIVAFAPWMIQAAFSGVVVIVIYLLVMSFRFLILGLAALPALWLIRSILRGRRI